MSFIPVIRTITGLADPYFDVSNTRVSRLPLLGETREVRLAWGLTIFLVVLNQLQVGISVRLSFFKRDWFNAIQNKDEAAFWSLLLTVFLFWAMIAVISNLIEYFIENVLKIRWREYLVDKYSGRWLGNGSHYRMGFSGGADNPDQRIAEDVRGYILNTYAFSISLLSTISNLVSFSIILWSIPARFAIPGTEIVVPGLPFWVALLYSVLGTWITHLIGRPLIKLDFKQEKYEADFRYQLARLREYAEQIALLKGEGAEREHIGRRFRAIVGNTYDLNRQNLKLSTFTSSYFQASVVCALHHRRSCVLCRADHARSDVADRRRIRARGKCDAVVHRALCVARQLQGDRRSTDNVPGRHRTRRTCEERERHSPSQPCRI